VVQRSLNENMIFVLYCFRKIFQDNLHRRHIVPTSLCNVNHSLTEDPLHAIWKCSALGSVWSSLSTFKQAVTPPPTDFFDLLSRFL